MKDEALKPKQEIKSEKTGEPYKLSDVNICGAVAAGTKAGESAPILTHLAITSDVRAFHELSNNFCNIIHYSAQQSGVSLNLTNANLILLVIKADNSAELWVDNVALVINVLVTRAIEAGEAVLERDVGDIREIDFPSVDFDPQDKVICILRQRWRFALYFDFNPKGAIDRSMMTKSLGTMYRTMRYRDIYDTLADQASFDQLIARGWFPFVEMITEFSRLSLALESGLDLDETETSVCDAFDDERLSRILLRWLQKGHFKAREEILRQAFRAYSADLFAPAIKTFLTEIEGILADSYQQMHGVSVKLDKLREFAVTSAENLAGAPDTLLFPSAFAKYLKSSTFKDFDPNGPKQPAGSRHAVGHGAADPTSYTRARALQAILTLDQLAFYT